MESKIAKAVKLEHSPVAMLWSDVKPEGATQFKPGRWGCVMFLLAVAAKGKPAVADIETFGCIGGGVGLGFGNQYDKFPGGIENYISSGNPEFCQSEAGRQIAAQMPDLVEGERYVKNPDIAKQFFDGLPMTEVPTKYVVFKPVGQVTPDETIKVVTFFARPDQLSALIVLANHARAGQVNVIAPFGAGCHQTGIIPLKEEESESPRAIIGLTDISARKNTMRMLGHDLLTFSVPLKMFIEMEENVEGSFLERNSWREVLEHQTENY